MSRGRLVTAVALVLAAAGCGSRGGVSEDAIKAVADAFHAPASWKVVSDRFEPSRAVCLGDNPCPSVERHWRPDAPLDLAGFTALAESTGWSPTISGDCRPLAASRILREVCAASADVDGYTAKLQQLRRGASGPVEVVLTVVEDR